MKTIAMLKKVLLLVLAAGALPAMGCGQVSYVEVEVTVSGTRTDCLFAISSCEVTVSGAASDMFALKGGVCDAPTVTGSRLGAFQYGTEAESGELNFHLELKHFSLKTLGQGDVSAPIKAGGRTMVTLPVQADMTAFTATGACP